MIEPTPINMSQTAIAPSGLQWAQDVLNGATVGSALVAGLAWHTGDNALALVLIACTLAAPTFYAATRA